MSEEKKIIIDEDWKSQVEAEKEAAKHTDETPVADESEAELGTDAKAKPTAAEHSDTDPTDDSAVEKNSLPEDPTMPPASIGMLMSSLATEALISMGQFPHPATGETIRRKNQAKYLIDTLEMLQAKTKGNLTSEEETALSDVLHQLRMAFIQIV